jgi:DNA-binding NarL/FixJ family response regulator
VLTVSLPAGPLLQVRNCRFEIAGSGLPYLLSLEDLENVLRCLIVDDSPLFVEAARILLEPEDVSIVGVATTAAEAIRRAEELRPDVTLVDVQLGGESGFELARRLEREVGFATSRMILMSTHAQEDYADLIVGTPVLGFLEKSALSADAIRHLLASQDDGDPPGRVSEPPGR